jgi:uncharacterized cupredoxin-like copper-binding protein
MTLRGRRRFIVPWGSHVNGNAIKRILFVIVPLLVMGAWLTRGAPAPVEVDVTMVDYRFVPDHLSFQHGVHYRLHLVNKGKQTHEFTAPEFFASAKIDNPDMLNREHTEIVMQPGDTKDLLLTPGAPGSYDLRCSDHDWDGMVGGITVL